MTASICTTPWILACFASMGYSGCGAKITCGDLTSPPTRRGPLGTDGGAGAETGGGGALGPAPPRTPPRTPPICPPGTPPTTPPGTPMASSDGGCSAVRGISIAFGIAIGAISLVDKVCVRGACCGCAAAGGGGGGGPDGAASDGATKYVYLNWPRSIACVIKSGMSNTIATTAK